MSKLKIYKASAGSGKTFTLTKEVIWMLFENPFDYRNILAVTFTNKATAEMKSRIITKLYAIWKENDDDYTDDLINIYKDKEIVSKRAGLILFLLLNDFSRFSVSTIDSFFQKIIRSFAQELGLNSNFKTELNSQKILNLAIDRLIMKLGHKDKKELREWLIQSAKENMEQGQNWNLSAKLHSLGKQIYSEEFQSFHQTFSTQINNKKQLNDYRDHINQILKEFESTLVNYATRGLDLIQKHQLKWEHFKGKSRSPIRFIEKMQNLDKFDATDKIEVWIDDVDEWYGTKIDATIKVNIDALYFEGMNEILKESIEFINKHSILYFSAKEIIKQFNALGIINDIAQEVDEICQEEMIYLLSNSNKLLKKIIANNDAPFIYEKCGSSLKHYMIDEFQDTSELQWSNFKPLIENSLSANGLSLLVGDVKQSIYRWRNSDWKLLAKKAKNNFEHLGYEELTLETNWRSYENIIYFNNALFEKASKILQLDLNNTIANANIVSINEEWTSIIEEAYSDIFQNTAKKNLGSGGEVNFQFLASDDETNFKDEATKICLSKIENLIEKGYKYKDICILVRKKDEAILITNALLSGHYLNNPIPVVSNESLVLSNSIAVNTIISQINSIIKSTNLVDISYIFLYQNIFDRSRSNADNIVDTSLDIDLTSLDNIKSLQELKGLPLLNLVELLIQRLPQEQQSNESVFLQTLIELTSEFIQNNGSDPISFIEWWENEGQNKTVPIPEEQDAVRVMTIHKSKGLEFNAVLMPFISWELDDVRHQEIIWCEDPFTKLDNIPVQYSKSLLKTYFSDKYITEHLHRFVDNINLLYVAFTRAKKYLFCSSPEYKKGLSKVSDLLFLSFSDQSFIEAFQTKNISSELIWNNQEFQFGKISSSKNNSKDNSKSEVEFSSIALPQLKLYDYSKRISIVVDSDNLMSTEIQNQINKGKIMHRAFEYIHTKDDVASSVKQLIIDGLIKQEEQIKFEKDINQLLSNDKVEDWFKPGLKVLTESSIISKHGTYIPDRVIIDNDKIIVIDYKFGEKHSQSHFRQVNHYVNLIKKMGYLNVSGFLWYAFDNKIITTNQNDNLTLF